MEHRFVNDCEGKFKVPLKEGKGSGKTLAYLLWGDHLRVLKSNGKHSEVKVRGRQGWIPNACVGDEGLLEIYIIDVGQGDGVLMRTPDDAWHLIDGGVENIKQMTKKGAANFVRWKFIEDLGRKKVKLRNVILSHSDFDHYGGLIDLFSGKVMRPDRTFAVEVENFYHSGMGRFAKTPKLGTVSHGIVAQPPFDDYGIKEEGDFITQLLDAKNSFGSPPRPFEETFARFASLVAKVPHHARRISSEDEYLPGYGKDDRTTIRILGPIVERLNGKAGLRILGGESVTRNGHSVVLRVDYGRARILLTGDLNTASQRLLLSHHDLQDFAVDVAKGCHHGSDDIDLRFVRAMKSRVTVISSGDNEDYAHPRPRVLGASARYGREAKGVNGDLLPPLLYSTELARSVQLSDAAKIRKKNTPSTELQASETEIKSKKTRARFDPLDEIPIATDLVYGLINVRTDGTRLLCAYMEERGDNFDIKALRTGVEPAL
jgi:beta-lactamase superfamily II metal-dependent hydrolase